MGLRTMLRQLATDKGLELDEAELDSLGLAEDEEGTPPAVDEVLSEAIPGRAAGQVEIFLGADSTTTSEALESKDGLMWYPIIREGQWAVRPGTTGSKRRVPLKVVAGKSKNQRREIGLQDLADAFDDEAVQHVTVPTSHNNTVLENTGFIKGMKIVDGTVKSKKDKTDTKVKVLMGGYDIKLPAVKEKLTLGAIANRSAGILYDYVNTETGKTYPAVIEHVALTNKPWITGMVSFGRKLREGTADPVKLDTVALSLSDDEPDDAEYALALSDEAELTESDQDFLAVAGATWDHETSPGWLRQQVNKVLDDARAAKQKAKRAQQGSNMLYVVDPTPYYRCVEAKPGMALISDGYSDDANFWVAPISVKDGVVELSDFGTWTTSKKAYVPDDRPPPPKDKLPLSESEQKEAANVPQKSRLQLAQEARRQRVSGQKPNPQTPREVVEHDMADHSGTLQLSEEAERIIQAANARAEAAEKRAEQLSDKVTRLVGTVQGGEVETYVKWLGSDEGLGLSEARGFSGVLAEIRQLMLADDGEPAVQSDHFAQDGNTTGELSLSASLKRVFGALQKATEGKKTIGEQLSQPADQEAGKTGSEDETGKTKDESGTNAGETAGKPGGGTGEGEKLSTEQKKDQIIEVSPQLAAVIGRPPVASKASSNGGGEG